MSATHKRVKLLTQYIEDNGLKLDAFIDKKDGRVWAMAIAHNGQQRSFSLSNSSTQDPRGDLNERSRIRRWATEMGLPSQMEEKIKEKLPELKRVVALEPKTVEEAAIMDAMDKLPRELEPEPEGPDTRTGFQAYIQPAPPVTRKIAILKAPRRRFHVADETPPAKPTPKPLGPGKRLTMHEQYKVIEWLKTIDTTEYLTPSQIATKANELAIIAIRVPDKTIADALKMLGMKLKDRRAGGPGEPRVNKDRIAMVGREVKRLGDSLGFQFSDDFLQWLKERSGQA